MATSYDFSFGTESKQAEANPFSAFQMIVLVAVVVLIAVTAFLLGILFERRTSPANSDDLATFWQAWDIIEQDFYGDVPTEEERKYGAIRGLVGSLNDPFTAFAAPEVAEVNRQQIDGHFGGIGVQIDLTSAGEVVIQRIIPGNPAEAAGLQEGDIFLEVDGQTVGLVGTDKLAEMVRGEIGTEVTLKIYRPSTDETFEVKVRRAIIEMPTVYTEDLGGIAHIQLNSFNGVATSQLEDNIQSALDDGAQAIILDLRGNGGGLLDQAVSVADLFLDEGLVLTQKGSDGEKVFESTNGQLAEDIPLVILVDGGTASASEVVAGALQDRNRATLVGLQTFGKGVVQLVYNLTDGSQLRVTSAAWYTPDGSEIHGVGLTPDIIVNEYYDMQGNDLIMTAAMNFLVDEYEIELELSEDEVTEDVGQEQ